MSQQKTKIVLVREVLDIDIPDIAEKFKDDPDHLTECIARVEEELERIRRHPNREGKECEYEPLRSWGCRKVKLFSNKVLQSTQKSTPDLRIIYRYDVELDVVRVDSIGFRIKEKPRAGHDPYSKAKKRVEKSNLE